MITSEDRTIRIDLDHRPGPISGSLRIGHEDQRRFEGWLQLTSLLERARGRSEHDGDER